MPILPTFMLPKNILTTLRRTSNHVEASPLLVEAAQSDAAELFRRLQTSENGLSEEEAEARLEQYGPNVVTQEQRHRRLKLLGRACVNPLVILLLLLAAISFMTGDVPGGHGHADHGRAGGGAAIYSGGAGRQRRGQAQGHDQRDGHRGPRRASRANCRWANSCPATWSAWRPAT